MDSSGIGAHQSHPFGKPERFAFQDKFELNCEMQIASMGEIPKVSWTHRELNPNLIDANDAYCRYTISPQHLHLLDSFQNILWFFNNHSLFIFRNFV